MKLLIQLFLYCFLLVACTHPPNDEPEKTSTPFIQEPTSTPPNPLADDTAFMIRIALFQENGQADFEAELTIDLDGRIRRYIDDKESSILEQVILSSDELERFIGSLENVDQFVHITHENISAESTCKACKFIHFAYATDSSNGYRSVTLTHPRDEENTVNINHAVHALGQIFDEVGKYAENE